MSYFCRTEILEKEAVRYRKDGVFTFIFVGRIVCDKGIDELVRAFCKLYRENNKIQLILVGPFEENLNPVAPDVRDDILTHKGIKFVGSQRDVRPFFMAADALVFPSYREGFPNVVMQAGAMGLPSIVTNINGCNEIIIPRENGVIIPVRDEKALLNAMCYFVNTPQVVKDMSAKSRHLVESRYDQQIVWREILKEYQSLF